MLARVNGATPTTLASPTLSPTERNVPQPLGPSREQERPSDAADTVGMVDNKAQTQPVQAGPSIACPTESTDSAPRQGYRSTEYDDRPTEIAEFPRQWSESNPLKEGR